MPHSQSIRQLALAAMLVLLPVTASAANCNAADFAALVTCAAGAGNGDTITLTANAQPDGTPVAANADVTLVNNGFLLDGAGQLVKSGTGTLTLPSNNAYSGGTTILSGTIAVAGPGGPWAPGHSSCRVVGASWPSGHLRWGPRESRSAPCRRERSRP